jgi:hypothetical protein
VEPQSEQRVAWSRAQPDIPQYKCRGPLHKSPRDSNVEDIVRLQPYCDGCSKFLHHNLNTKLRFDYKFLCSCHYDLHIFLTSTIFVPLNGLCFVHFRISYCGSHNYILTQILCLCVGCLLQIWKLVLYTFHHAYNT